MATELYVFVLVRVTVDAPLIRASLVRITPTGTRNRIRVSVNAALGSAKRLSQGLSQKSEVTQSVHSSRDQQRLY